MAYMWPYVPLVGHSKHCPDISAGLTYRLRLQVKILFEGRFQIVGVMDGGLCPAEDFLLNGEASTEAARIGLEQILEFVAENGLEKASAAWVHEANKQKKIYEFIKGPLRLFFFKGSNGQIAVCTSGVRKQGAKADKGAVNAAADLREAYEAAINADKLEIIQDED